MQVFIHVIGSYQVYTMPVLDMIEMQASPSVSSLSVPRLTCVNLCPVNESQLIFPRVLQMVKHRISNGLISRLIYRSLYVCIITFVAGADSSQLFH